MSNVFIADLTKNSNSFSYRIHTLNVYTDKKSYFSKKYEKNLFGRQITAIYKLIKAKIIISKMLNPYFINSIHY